MRMPGTTPPMKRPPTEAPVTSEKKTITRLGGMMGPMMEADAVTAAA